MYIVKRYSVALARARLAELLDEAERGVPVAIERRGVGYRLTVDAQRRPRRSRPPGIEILDPSVGVGRWSWDWTPAGLTFHGRSRR